MIGKALLFASLYGAGAYALDVPIRREMAARKARAYADKKGKPLLNIGAGTNKTAFFGKTLYGDVNVDLYGRKDVPHGTPGVVTFADAQDLHDFDNNQFGAVLATNIVEHLDNPQQAIAEMKRVTGNDPDALFVVTPLWWDPVTYLHPGHLWYATDGAGGTRGGQLKRIRKEFNPTLKQITNLRGM